MKKWWRHTETFPNVVLDRVSIQDPVVTAFKWFTRIDQPTQNPIDDG